MMEGLIALIGGLGLVVVFVVAFFWNLLVAWMARNRNRSGLFWFLVSFIITPLASMILLLLLGDN